jgi:hypothetical protein
MALPLPAFVFNNSFEQLVQKHLAEFQKHAIGLEDFPCYSSQLLELQATFQCGLSLSLYNIYIYIYRGAPSSIYCEITRLIHPSFLLIHTAGKSDQVLRNNQAIDSAITAAGNTATMQFKNQFTLRVELPMAQTKLVELYEMVSANQLSDFQATVGNFSYVALFPVRYA